MKIEQVKKLSPLQRFLYWIKERHSIYLSKEAGEAKPWTHDEILQSYFFTNPYRENDKVTKWFKKHVREPLRNDPRVVMATVIFRWFNLPATGLILKGGFAGWNHKANLLTNWNRTEAVKLLGKARSEGQQVFTGAFMINSPPGKPKLEAICDRIDAVWRDRERLLGKLNPHGAGAEQATLEEAHAALTQYEGLGGFMAYEVVCDLRYTYLLENASDKLTWCNPGPGCIRGLYRIAGEDWPSKGNNATSPPKPKNWRERMNKLLHTVKRELAHLPPFEMREIEHSLCEYDKYERMLWGDGKAKRTYNGKA